MYITRKQPSNNGPLIVAFVAFALTVTVVLAIALVREPDQLAAAFALPELITRTPTVHGQGGELAEPTATPTRLPTNTRTPTNTPTPAATLVPTATPYPFVEHLILGRPVAPDASSTIADSTYLYGTTGRGEYEVHHGQEFVNPLGTPILAVGDGTILVAGHDDMPLCGQAANEPCGRMPDYYGNVVILKLDQTYQGNALFAVYGHVSEVLARPGQRVRQGEIVARVGSEGIAIGPHLHFEVRFGVSSYAATRNPTLWLQPLPGHGSLAGRVQDSEGNALRGVTVILYADDLDGTYLKDTETYMRDEFPLVNSDDVLGENWALPDLPAGNYVVRAWVGGLAYYRRITLQPGHLTFLVFGGR